MSRFIAGFILSAILLSWAFVLIYIEDYYFFFLYEGDPFQCRMDIAGYIVLCAIGGLVFSKSKAKPKRTLTNP